MRKLIKSNEKGYKQKPKTFEANPKVFRWRGLSDDALVWGKHHYNLHAGEGRGAKDRR